MNYIQNTCYSITLYLLFFAWPFQSIKAQSETNLPNFAPLAPEVANLARYSETPVNLYTGVPNISVPFYTIKTSNMEIPISISYHAGGHKVEDIASWVGLGWSLNAGGVIYRQTRQLPDDAPVGYIRTPRTVQEWDESCSSSIDCGGVSPTGFFKGNLEIMSLNGLIDYAPDTFNFSFLGYSGSFYFNQNRTTENPYGELIQSPVSDIKIQYFFKSNGFFDAFHLTTPDGNKFIFESSNGDFLGSSISLSGEYNSGSLPVASPSASDSNNVPHNTSWKLTKIVLTSGEKIEFEYDSFQYLNRCTPTSESGYTHSSTISGFVEKFSVNLSSGQNTRIQKIKFNNGYVVFNTQNTFRQDLSYDKALDEVLIYSDISNNGTGILVEKIKLNYGYFESSTTDNYSVCLGNYDAQEIRKRLRLEEVIFYGNVSNNPSSIKKSFEYNNEVLLPHRYSKAQDYWGYYNGKNSNIRLIPTMFLGINPAHPVKSLYKRANREIDPDYTQACILTKINHSEGGYTSLIYENNERHPNQEFFGFENIFEPSILIDNYQVSSNQELINENGKRYFRTNITIPQSLAYRGWFEFSTSSTICSNAPSEGNNYNVGNLPIIGCDIRFHIKNRVFGQPNATHPYGVPIGYNGSFYIEPGIYTLEIEINSSNINLTNQQILVNVNWRENRFPNKKFIGGVRVKEIKDFESNNINPDSAATNTRIFVYETNFNESSGWIKGVPIFSSIGFEGQRNADMGVYVEKVSSNNTNPSISTNSNYVGYTVVREYKISENDEIVQESNFTFQPNQSSQFDSPTYLDWVSGRLFKMRIFRKKEGSSGLGTTQLDQQFDLIKEVNSSFHNPDLYKELYPNSSGVNLFGTFYSSFLGVPGAPQGDYSVPYYILTAPNFETKKQTTKDYFYQNGEVREVTSSTEYIYEGMVQNQLPTTLPKHLNPVKIVQDFEGTITEQHMYYPKDLTNNSLFNQTTLNQLILQNQVNTPLLKESWQNGQKLSTLVTHYKDWGNNAFGQKVLLPELIQTAKGDHNPLPLETRLRYVNINPLGAKTREVKQENGSSVVYLWGYNNSLPVAKIENLPYNSIPSNIRNAVELANTEGALVQALTNLREALATSEALVTTFTHIPLVGVKTITDPKGDMVTYHYDEFNRLIKVTDKYDNILSEHEYHYRTQN